jgi:hypothetical protein
MHGMMCDMMRCGCYGTQSIDMVLALLVKLVV